MPSADCLLLPLSISLLDSVDGMQPCSKIGGVLAGGALVDFRQF